MTQITFERTGGLLGRKVHLSLDLDKMPADQSRELQQLINEADFFSLPENLITRPLPDEFIYTISINAAAKRQTVRLSDTSAPEALRPLLADLSRRARSGNR
jgi:hypothetical protein